MIGRKTNVAIIFFSIVFVLYKTIYPFGFTFRETYSNTGLCFLFLGWGKSGIFDVVLNILLFVPLGFGLSGYLLNTLKLTFLKTITWIFVICFGLSYTIEVLQLFQPSRFPSLVDVISNCSGGTIFLFCIRLWRCKIKIIDYSLRVISKNFLLVYLGYAAFALLISIPLQQTTSLTNWDRTFHLLLGNEKTGERPWQGYVSDLYIADSASSEIEALQIASEMKTADSRGDSLLAWYQLRGKGAFRDRRENLPDLRWVEGSQSVQNGEGVFLDANRWLESVTPAVYLAQRIRETSQLTLGIRAAAGDTKQSGPARIVSFSKDHYHCNFTLGQDGDNLVFRLRSPLTGKVGCNPELIVPDVFSSLEPQNIVVTHDGAVLNVYVNDKLSSRHLDLNPGAALFGILFPLNAYNIKCFKALYYAFFFIPLGILMIFRVKMMRRGVVIKLLIISVGIILPSFVLETLLIIVSGKVVSMGNLITGVIFTASPVFFLRYVTPVFLKKRQRSTNYEK